MQYQSVNPYSGEMIRDFPLDPFPDLSRSKKAFNIWRKLSIGQRGEELRKLAIVIENNKEKFARIITLEMGKPYKEALYEIAKVLTAFDYYIAGAPSMLKQETVKTAASKSYISFEPLGVIFSVMPWNFPFWQVFRFAVPALMAGNVTILKHAPSVSLCAEAMENAFAEAGIMDGVFTKYHLSNEDAAALIAHPDIHGVSFTGSDVTGSIIAAQAGKYIKKCVIELGGNDAFIVLPDADMEMAVAGAVKSRSINSGQSCNAAKRFIVVGEAHDIFTKKLIEQVLALNVGDPMNENTQIGPLARLDLADKVRKQISETVSQGALPHYHATNISSRANFVAPVVLTNVQPGMRAFEEEIFGPVWSVIKADSVQEAIDLARSK